MNIFNTTRFLVVLALALATLIPSGFSDTVFAKVKLLQQQIVSPGNSIHLDLRDYFQVHPAPGPILTIDFRAPEVDGYRQVVINSQGVQESRLTYNTVSGIPYLNLHDAFSENLVWLDHTLSIQLWPEIAPLNVANFLTYVSAGYYNHTIIHRVRVAGSDHDPREPADELLQAGAIRLAEPALPPLTADSILWNTQFPRVALEAEGSHNKGTLAIARPREDENPNSATNQFFINTSDNSEKYNGQYSVIGELISDNIEVLKELTQANLFEIANAPFWQNFPLYTPYADDPDSYLALNHFSISAPLDFAESYSWSFIETDDGLAMDHNSFDINLSEHGALEIRTLQTGNAHLRVSAIDAMDRKRSLDIHLAGISDRATSVFGTNLNRNPNRNGIVEVSTGGRYEVDWIGEVTEMQNPYFHWSPLGHAIVYRINASSFMIHTDPVGWLWTGPAAYPWLYSVKYQTWFYLINSGGTDSQRWVFSPEGVEGYHWFPLDWLP
jgi:cyclophilin family peptidyl-prolyl cis-trans isomerase